MGANEQAALRQHAGVIRNLQKQLNDLTDAFNQLQQRPQSVQEQLDATPGRRIDMILSGEITFTTDDSGQRGTPIIIQVSQDGPFVMTHYPMALWRPSLPSTATNLGRWRPVSTFPLPDQVVDTDIIDIMYELNDAGSQRFMQNNPRGPVLSRPDNIVPCPVPTLWSPNAAIQFVPIYNAITFNGSPTPPTQGILHVDLIGYRIVNM
jgi:hypothetical protein